MLADPNDATPRSAVRSPARGPRLSRQARAVQEARTCYDHLAGRAGVALLDALLEKKILNGAGDDTALPGGVPVPGHRPLPREFVLTEAGAATLAAFGIDVEAVRRSRRPFAGACLDWTQRRPHLKGALGAAITARMLDLRWFERVDASRALRVTGRGCEGLAATFGCAITPPVTGGGL
jgi:hypothetical protein